MYVRDGQLVSWDLRLHVSPDLPTGVQPVLCLYAGHAVTSPTAGELEARLPKLVAFEQKFTGGAAEDGADASHVGTLLHFAPLQGVMPFWKPMMRVRPVLSWTGADGLPMTLVAPRVVNIGQAPTAWAFSLGTVVLFLLLLRAVVRRSGASLVSLLLHGDGHLSLSLLQMAVWTLVIGAVVLFFGIVQLQVPEIPASLIVLMGMSLATTGISYQADQQPVAAAGAPPPTHAWRLADLVAQRDGANGEFSLARAQMLFWTLLLVIIFVAKSVLTGALWAIPWELVALMGVSQAGYVAPKVVN